MNDNPSHSAAFQGDIAETPLPDVLEALRRQKSTGTLMVRRDHAVKCIFINEGQIVFATSTEKEDRLGEILVKNGKLTRAQLEDALLLFEKKGGFKKFGAILVENGLLPPKELFTGLKIQVRDIIASLFLWQDGIYVFEKDVPSDIIHLHLDFQQLIADIIQKIKQEN